LDSELRIDLLLKRNNYQENFNSALSKYLLYKYSWKGDIIWKKSRVCQKREKVLSVFEKINIIAGHGVNRTHIIKLGKEFGYHQNPLRNFLQDYYVNHIFNFPISMVSSNNSINLFPYTEDFGEVIIIPGNHSVRFMEYDSGRSIVVPHESAREFAVNEIKLRPYLHNLSAPSGFEVIDELNGYSEEIISGIPVNRLSDRSLEVEVVNKVKNELSQLYSSTYRIEKKDDYIYRTQNKCLHTIETLKHHIVESAAVRILNIQKSIWNMLAAELPDEVPVAMTHGDLQFGNILTCNENINRFYLIDWEYCANRMLYYDAMVLDLNARFPSNISKRLTNLSVPNEIEKFNWASPGNFDQEISIKALIYSFLAEDLILRLQEAVVNKNISVGFSTFIAETEKHLGNC